MARAIFRKTALDRLSSPEQLDQLMRVTSPTAWLAFLALAGLVVAALLWSIMGTLPVEVTGSAMVIRQGGIRLLQSSTGGQLVRLHGAVGDVVPAGAPLAELANRQTIDAPFDVHILDVRVAEGSLLEPGTPLLSFERAGAGLTTEAVMVLAPDELRQVRAGMPVRLNPLHGNGADALAGEVVEVAEFPTTAEGLVALLGSPELGALLTGGTLGYLVRIRLDPADGDLAALPSSGTLASASILVEQRRPIEYVLR